MKSFVSLFNTIDQSPKTAVKVAALADYFATAPESDRIWTIAIFSGRRPKRVVTTTKLRAWGTEHSGIPLWLFEESYPIVGDLAETIALALPQPDTISDCGLTYWINTLRTLSNVDEKVRKAAVLNAWDCLDTTQRFLFNKLLTGGFRIGISQKLMTRALACATNRDEAEMAHRLMGDWDPVTTTWHDLIEADDPSADASRPFPFHLAHELDTEVKNLGNTEDWQAEWKWNGIRGQLILRDGAHFLWSRGDELMTDRFPEFARARDFLPDGTVLDGEILVWGKNGPQSFNALQKRIGRKATPKKLLQDAPVVLYTYDVLECDGVDIGQNTLDKRRATLGKICQNLPTEAPIKLSPTLPFDTWDDLAQIRSTARHVSAKGVMLKRHASPYLTERKKGDWWKWKLDPLTIDAVMIYAHQDHGQRTNPFTDFTFAVWNGNDLVPFTKAYSGLTDDELHKITAWVKKNTRERFGPVRSVTPEHVFEIAFEGIQSSSRHKSGIALHAPRISRWRHDKSVQEANTLDDLNEMLATYG